MYVHCHSCSWSQDDFWSKSYNPATQLWQDIQLFWVPRMVNTESRGHEMFSWAKLARCFYWRLTAPFTQKWWTHESWKQAVIFNDGYWPPCPQCGADDLDID